MVQYSQPRQVLIKYVSMTCMHSVFSVAGPFFGCTTVYFYFLHNLYCALLQLKLKLVQILMVQVLWSVYIASNDSRFNLQACKSQSNTFFLGRVCFQTSKILQGFAYYLLLVPFLFLPLLPSISHLSWCS